MTVSYRNGQSGTYKTDLQNNRNLIYYIHIHLVSRYFQTLPMTDYRGIKVKAPAVAYLALIGQ